MAVAMTHTMNLPTRIPERIQKLPTYKGYPIPVSVMISDAGIPDFRVSNENKRLELLYERRCGICGEDLTIPLYFLGGPKSMYSHLFFDPPMHEECARFSFEVCPYLAGRKDYAPLETVQQHHPSDTVHVVPMAADAPVTSIGLLACADYYLLMTDDTNILIQATKISGEVEWLRGDGT